LLNKAEYPRFPSAISPDDKFLLFREENPSTGQDLWLMPLDAGEATQARPWIQTPFNEMMPSFSPDGRFVAYVSNESGESEIFVARFPDGSMRRQISTSGGSEPLWAANGREVFYRRRMGESDLLQVVAVDVATQPSFSAGSPRALFEEKSWTSDVPSPMYAVTPDGQHFLLLKPSTVEPARQIHVVLNWFEELKRRVPVGTR